MVVNFLDGVWNAVRVPACSFSVMKDPLKRNTASTNRPGVHAKEAVSIQQLLTLPGPGDTAESKNTVTLDSAHAKARVPTPLKRTSSLIRANANKGTGSYGANTVLT